MRKQLWFILLFLAAASAANAPSLLEMRLTPAPLEEARTAHEMLAGAAHKPGTIVLKVAA